MKQGKNHPIGNGSFATVFKDIWGNMPDKIKTLSQHPDTMPVAIKKPSKHPMSKQMLIHEIAIHRRLSHSNIVAFLGVLDEPQSGNSGLVMELILDGDLFDMLAAHKGPVSSSLQLVIALGIARGLHYLHDLKILHRDLKCENILIEKHGETTIAKICDFGMAESVENYDGFNELCGSLEYMAPELLNEAPPYPYSTKSDIYAFSLIMWMLTSQCNPNVVTSGHRETFSKDVRTDFKNLIIDCWKQNPEHRPVTFEISNRLTEMQTLSPDSAKTVTETPLSTVRKKSGLTTFGIFAGVTIAFIAASNIANSYSSQNG
jgi:serine/threonine protein kinase